MLERERKHLHSCCQSPGLPCSARGPLPWNVRLCKEQAMFLLIRQKLHCSDTGRHNAFLQLSGLVKASLGDVNFVSDNVAGSLPWEVISVL